LSYYDNTFQPGTTYEFTLQTVNTNAIKSTPVSLFLTTAEKMPTINLNNAESIIEHVISVTNSTLFGKDIARAESIVAAFIRQTPIEEIGYTKLFSELDDDFYLTSEYNCNIDGQMITTEFQSTLPDYTITWNDCASTQFDKEMMNGEVDYDRELSKYVYNTGINSDITYNSVTSNNQVGIHRELAGSYNSFSGPGKNWVFSDYNTPLFDDQNNFILDENGEVKTTYHPFVYTSAAFEGQTRLQIIEVARFKGKFESVDSTDTSNDWRHRLTADFTIQSPATGNKTITVTTPVEFFSDQKGDCFASGQLKLSADDGSELLLNAQTDSIDTFSMEVFADGVRTQNTLPWSEPFAKLHLTPDAIELFYDAGLNDIPQPADCTTG